METTNYENIRDPKLVELGHKLNHEINLSEQPNYDPIISNDILISLINDIWTDENMFMMIQIGIEKLLHVWIGKKEMFSLLIFESPHFYMGHKNIDLAISILVIIVEFINNNNEYNNIRFQSNLKQDDFDNNNCIENTIKKIKEQDIILCDLLADDFVKNISIIFTYYIHKRNRTKKNNTI